MEYTIKETLILFTKNQRRMEIRRMVTRRKETNLLREESHPKLLQLHLLLDLKSYHLSLIQMLLQKKSLP